MASWKLLSDLLAGSLFLWMVRCIQLKMKSESKKSKLMKKSGFSLIELLITVALISVVSTMAIGTIFVDIPEHKVQDGLKDVEQIIKQAKSIAMRESTTIIVDFSSAASNQGDNGGLIEIEASDGTVFASYYLKKDVVFDSGSSTISGSELRLDYFGQPVDNAGAVTGFTDSNNTIALNYSDVYTETIQIEPVTGNIDFE